MLRRILMSFLGCLAIASVAFSAVAAPAQQSPEEFVLKVSNEILDAIKNSPKLQQGDKNAVEALVDEKMMPAVDFLRMTRMAVGPKWKEATPAQQEQLQTLFRETLIQVYSGGLSMAKDQKVRILPRGQNDGTEAIVRTGMSSTSDPSKPEIQMVYRLRNIKDQGWKVIDVNIEGVWLVSNYRNQYGPIAAQEGISGLIRRMQDRVDHPESQKK